MPEDTPFDRLHARAALWSVEIDRTIDTESSLTGMGRRGPQGVVLKIIKERGDEWMSGAVVRAFDGRGVVHIHECDDGALLLDLLSPGYSLASIATAGGDESATSIIADVIQQMDGASAPPGCPDVMDWCAAFDRYLSSGDQRLPRPLIEDARARFASLASSQRRPRLLHGDLQHYNILFDTTKGWLAIDPKGVIGEVEYEVGAMLRNPFERPELFVSGATVTRRVTQLSGLLDIDPRRTLEWGYVQAVLSALWCIEDGQEIAADSPVVRLAHVIRSLIATWR
jgi:streptomycin 6-kinase